MYAHRIESIIDETGTVKLGHLPFSPGDLVEIIILKKDTPVKQKVRDPLSFAQAAQALRGKITNAPADLSTNPAHFDGFGE